MGNKVTGADIKKAHIPSGGLNIPIYVLSGDWLWDYVFFFVSDTSNKIDGYTFIYVQTRRQYFYVICDGV